MLAMMADIGSTFTKLTVVDLEREGIVATSQAPTTIEDITIGFQQAILQAELSAPIAGGDVAFKSVCSSAAGGLRMVTVGLVPELTVEAAKRAALGAGAKVVGSFSHMLTEGDLQSITSLKPDILLLSGGTDGGNERSILHNTGMLAGSTIKVPVVVAGNRAVSTQLASTLRASGREVWLTENVMPEVGVINIGPAQAAIREIFLKRIVVAKGLDKLEQTFAGVSMPTPSAVLEAAVLLAQGVEGEPGWGDLVVVDVGGATTDVHSVGLGQPTKPGVLLRGLPEPFAKRTVEGDMGIRYNAPTILEIAGEKRLGEAIKEKIPDLVARVTTLSEHVDLIPRDDADSRLDIGLARSAVEIAIDRHVGTLQIAFTPFGEMAVQNGKDLTEVGHVIGTGGIFAYSAYAREILEGALFDEQNPLSLRPRKPSLMVDKEYAMAAMGLLAAEQPAIALRLLKKGMVPA